MRMRHHLARSPVETTTPSPSKRGRRVQSVARAGDGWQPCEEPQRHTPSTQSAPGVEQSRALVQFDVASFVVAQTFIRQKLY